MSVLIRSAEFMPENFVLQQIRMNIDKYMVTKDPVDRDSILAYCYILIVKREIEGTKGGANELIKELARFESAKKLFIDIDKNVN